MIEGDFIHKGVGHSSQDQDLEYKKYLMLLFQEQLALVVPIEKRKGGVKGVIREEPWVSL